MKRAILALTMALGLMIGTGIPVSGLGETNITLNCDDGTSMTMALDADGLTALTASVQSLLDYPAGLSCSLLNLGPALRFGSVAYAWKKEPWVNGGGHFSRPCPGGSGIFWTNVAVNVHDQDRVIGTFNLTIPGNQCVPQGHFHSTPTCLTIDPVNPPGARAWILAQIQETSGDATSLGGGAAPGVFVRASFEDNGNPGQQSTKDKLNWSTEFANTSTCPSNTPPFPVIELTDGNITIHPGQL
jgi:hypothetical protein